MSSAPLVLDGTRHAGSVSRGLNWGLIAVLLGCMAFWAVVAIGLVALI